MARATIPAFPFTRSYYTPKDFQRLASVEALGVEVMADASGTLIMGFAGKRSKPDFYTSFASKERAEQYVARWIAGLQEREQEKLAKRQARKRMANPLQLGDILKASWGYEQTNIDYYEVTKVIGTQTVEVREIGKDSEESDGMQGVCVPAPGSYKSAAKRHRVNPDGSIKVQSWGVWASKVECVEVAGVKVFKPDCWSSYY